MAPDQDQSGKRWDEITSIGGPVAAAFMRLSVTVSQLEERTNRHEREIREGRQEYDSDLKEIRQDIKGDLTSIQSAVKEISIRMDDLKSKLSMWQTVAWILTIVGMVIGGTLTMIMNVKHVIG